MQRIQQYRSRLGGPLVDRIDMTIVIPRPNSDELIDEKGRFSSKDIREKVANAQAFREKREQRMIKTSARTNILCEYLDTHEFTRPAQSLLKSAANSFKLSGRALNKVCRVARTIADLSCEETVDIEQVAESLNYRKEWASYE